MTPAKKPGKRTSKKGFNKQRENVISSSISVKGYYAIIFILMIIFIDRITKVWAITLKNPINHGFIAFLYITNTGAGFSILQNSNTILLWLSIIILGAIIYFREYFPIQGFLLIISGLIGNLLDRIFYGQVIDFISIKFWPVFNVADSMITIGAIITAIYWIKKDVEHGKMQKKLKGRGKPSKRTR